MSNIAAYSSRHAPYLTPSCCLIFNTTNITLIIISIMNLFTWGIHTIEGIMHPKIMKRRGLVISEQLAEIDRDIKAVAASIARRVRLAGVLCIGDEEADNLEEQFHDSVEAVLEIPSISDAGRRGRRELIAKLIELEAYLDSLFNASWVTSELIARCRQNLDRCRTRLERIKAAE